MRNTRRRNDEAKKTEANCYFFPKRSLVIGAWMNVLPCSILTDRPVRSASLFLSEKKG